MINLITKQSRHNHLRRPKIRKTFAFRDRGQLEGKVQIFKSHFFEKMSVLLNQRSTQHQLCLPIRIQSLGCQSHLRGSPLTRSRLGQSFLPLNLSC
jgi:hypothetical protein